MLKSAPDRVLRVGRSVVTALRWRADRPGARMGPPSQSASDVWAGPELETGDRGTEVTGGKASMENAAGSAARTEMRHPLTKWVDEMQDVLRAVTTLMEDNERLQTVADSSQREHADAQEQLARSRADLQQQRGLAESTQREV